VALLSQCLTQHPGRPAVTASWHHAAAAVAAAAAASAAGLSSCWVLAKDSCKLVLLLSLLACIFMLLQFLLLPWLGQC
jgi:hypothetical protein